MTRGAQTSALSDLRPAEARYRWRLLRAGPIALDGGGMFGVIPRVLWSKMIPPDANGRITLGHNCLLLEPADESQGTDPILIETGSGDKFDAKMKKIFGLNDRSVIDALSEAGCDPETIEHVIVTHLHFDHAGGLTRRLREGEMPDWRSTAPDQPGVKLTFPRARVYVQQREWEDALANNSVMTRTYLRENLQPIRGQLRLIDSPIPFPPGHHPRKDESPATSLASRTTPILPGIEVFLVPGHTWGQQAVRFTDDRGRIVVFTPDVLPTVHHSGAAYNLAYDVEPYTSTITRRWFLDEAAKGDWLLALDHEPGNPCVRVRPDGKGWWTLIVDGDLK